MVLEPPASKCRAEWLGQTSSRILQGLIRAAAGLLRSRLAVITLGEASAQHPHAQVVLGAGVAPDPLPAGMLELCARVIAEDGAVVVECAGEPQRWAARAPGEAPLLDGFAGVPLRVRGRVVGTLAVLDPGQRHWSREELAQLRDLADAAQAELERADLEMEREDLIAAVRQRDSRYARLTQTSYVGIWVTDAQGQVTEVNDAVAEILGRPVGSLLGADFRELLAPEDRDKGITSFESRLAGRVDTEELELRVIRPGGERRLLQVWVAPMLENGVVVGAHGVVRDITEERAREAHFRRAERMASVAPLLSGVCHELNNPLTSIKSFAELLLLDERSPEDREALEIVQREAHRAAKIVTDLRVVARQSQEVGTGRGMVNLNEAVRHVLTAYPLAQAGVEVQVDLAENLPSLWAVRPHVEQVVKELVNNAVHAMHEQPGPRRMTVRTFIGGVGVALQVDDTGHGIPADHMDRIFDPFWTTRRAGEGTGLGLSLVHGIITDHGGRVRVDSAEGRGTSFVIEFPVSDQPLVGLGTVESDSSASRALRILVVDDEAAIRYSLTRYMERRGHRVDQADEGGSALSRLDEASDDPYDVIVADLRMPGLSGGDLLARLRERPGSMEERLIFITGDTDRSDLAQEVDYSGVPMVQKPFELAEIAQIIESHAGLVLP